MITLIFLHFRRCGFKIEEPNGGNVSVLLQSQSPHGQSPWHRYTIDIPKLLGLARPTAAWTLQVLGRGLYHITWQSRAMHLLFTCTIRCRRTGIRRGPLLQIPLHTAPKSAPWQHQLTVWGDPQSRILTSPSRSMGPPSNFHLVRMLHHRAHVNLLVRFAADHQDPWHHKIFTTNTSVYRVPSGTTLALQRSGWRPRNIQWLLIWRERIMVERMCNSRCRLPWLCMHV